MSDVQQSEIYRKILLLMMRSKRRLSKAAEKHDMTVAQAMMLMLFEPDKGKSMQNLSCLMGCDASNVTGLVERLDNQGIIKRTADPQDGRVKLIELSDDGLTRRTNILQELQTAEESDMQKLSPAEQVQLIRLINKLMQRS